VDLTTPAAGHAGAAGWPGLDPARALDPARYALSGAVPRHAVRPTSRDEVADALRTAARDGLSVVPWGGGTALPHEPAPERYDLALAVGGLDRVVEYDPEDLTITAECGVTIETLRATLAERGQELPLEAPLAGYATLGGVLAANASGPRRLRFGSPRDRVLGARYALGGGTLARTGGRVVKNVAGYALHRMLCGSRGGLAVILEASLKLMPAPQARVALVFDAGDASPAGLARWAALPRLEPAAVTVTSPSAFTAADGTTRTCDAIAIVVLEDDAAWVAEQERRVTAALGAPLARSEGAAVPALLQGMCDATAGPVARLTFGTAANTPAALFAARAALPGATLVLHAPAGRLHALAPLPEPGPAIEALARAGFALLDAHGVEGAAPVPPPFDAVRDLRERIRAAVDPGGRFALGARWVASI
jgi:glycolate oxidase FAD binding subunit